MSNERKPLVSDSQCEFVGFDSLGPADAAETIRDHYEYLITEGKLRVVEEVELVGNDYDCMMECSGCGWHICWQYIDTDITSTSEMLFCPGCGNKIKRQ